tara:strand:- start:1973 stop:2146 length:174 start_codon:yes stop_codon:yes gene_type:complete
MVMDGRQAYEADRKARPNYHNGKPRPAWDDLDDIAQHSWVKSPSPREWKPLPTEAKT